MCQQNLRGLAARKYPYEELYYVCGRSNGSHAWIEHNEIGLAEDNADYHKKTKKCPPKI